MRPSRPTHDVVVVGAGAAGLAAADALRDAAFTVAVVEARNRIGGRVLTVRDPDLAVPIELGAEFVHGRADELQPWLLAARLRTTDITGTRWRAGGGRLTRLHGFWTRLARVMSRLPDERQEDMSLDAFLRARPGGRRLARDRTLARQFVMGFHAADPRLISARALADGGSPGDDSREERLGRVVEGYARILDPVAARLGALVQLSSIVTSIEWSPGSVRVRIRNPDTSRQRTIAARAAIVAIPLGVLKATPPQPGAIAFTPPLAAKAAVLERLAMGSVQRVVFHCRSQFWASEAFARHAAGDGASLDQLAFLHIGDDSFSTWWTAYPTRTPILVAWCGGPPAEALSGLPAATLIERALSSLSRATGMSRHALRGQILEAWTHDWNRDPFARGAYSYQTVGGSRAPAALARPIANTLFFAGEASESSGGTGTVHGAIATGIRAARQVAKALG